MAYTRFYPMTELVAAVQEHATENYETSGWDIVTETMDYDAIRAILQGRGMERKARVRTPRAAIKRVAEHVGIVDEVRADVIAAGVGTVLDIECPSCKAGSGEACHTPKGVETKEPHKARRDAFAIAA